MDFIDQFLAYAGTDAVERAINVALAVLGAIAAFLLWFFGALGKLYQALVPKVDEESAAPSHQIKDAARGGFAEATSGGVATGQVIGNQTINQGPPSGHMMLSVEDFRAHLKAEREETSSKLRAAHDSEKAELNTKLKELERQLADPEAALKEAQERIKDLEARLGRLSNEIDPERLAEARALLKQPIPDYDAADAIFADIAARNELAVQQTARAEYGRGEIAEAEIRWHDAYTHFKRAADLHDDVDDLKAYARMTWRLAKGDEAVRAYQRLVDLVKVTDGETSAPYATQLNNLALVVQAQGRYAEAEDLFKQALEIDRATIGEGHPDYASGLNNLAGVVQAQGRYPEAEDLYKQALEIGRATIGEEHPDYATRLNNLAGVVQAQGRYAEAEDLYKQALEIGRTTIGEAHPEYATRLNNLAGVLMEQKRWDEAEPLFEQSLAILEATLPPDHPHIEQSRKNLEVFHARRAAAEQP
ncbi:MAG: tetratricopeptide repeat protein [Pseudomonadota bacterium]